MALEPPVFIRQQLVDFLVIATAKVLPGDGNGLHHPPTGLAARHVVRGLDAGRILASVDEE